MAASAPQGKSESELRRLRESGVRSGRLARERQLQDAGRIREEERQVLSQPVRRSRPAAQSALKLSPMVIVCTVALAAMVVVLLMGYARLTRISSSVVAMKSRRAHCRTATWLF